MKKREARRDQTLRVALRRWKKYVRLVGGFSQVAQDLATARPIGTYRKRGTISCGCRRKHKGNPKVIRGMCHGVTGYHPSAMERMDNRRLCRKWLRDLRYLDAIDIEL